MKTLTLRTLFVTLATALLSTSARAQLPTFHAADRVLGAANFTTAGSGAATPAGMLFPAGLSIDPLSGKLFVAVQGQHRVLRFPAAAGLSNGANAEAVIGQLNFSGITPGSTATTLNTPNGIHVDSSGRLWIADSANHRVLMFQGASTLPGFGVTPDLVLGQPDFTTVTPGTTDTTLNGPTHVFVDAADHLWVADSANHRVLKFANASSLTNGAAATTVLGQGDFLTGTSATSATGMDSPSALVVDQAGRLWVAEKLNHRVLRFDAAASLGNGASATAVLGQPDFTTSTSGTTAQEMNAPSALLVDPSGTLYLSDFSNNRVLVFRNAAAKSNGAAADGVIGQPDFTNTAGATARRKLKGPHSGLVLDAAGRLWVADSSNHRVLRYSQDLSVKRPKVTSRVRKITRRASLAVSGTAADLSGITQVHYRVGKRAFRTAAGTTSWTFRAKLRPGNNRIEIVAVDGVGNVSAPRRVWVRRR